jgi:phosphate transport system ATP-binding protein
METKSTITSTYIGSFAEKEAIRTKKLNVHYPDKQAIFDVDLSFPAKKITSLIGASGSGKSTYLRSLNRMNDKIATITGEILYQRTDINSKAVNVYEVRKEIGMVFQRPNPFAKSIQENILFALKKQGMTDKNKLAKRLETSLRQAALWDEVKDSLDKSALSLSGGQQQRLCIARTLALQPKIILLDEPASALDPISTAKLEQTLQEIKKLYSIIIVTHNMQQASRLSDYTAFFHQGRVVEFNQTAAIFQTPEIELTQNYVSGHFG